MSYYSGTAANLSALWTAIRTHAVIDGWTLVGNVLSKAGVYFDIQVTATNITCLGCESDAVANPAPNVVSMGRLWSRSGFPTREITFPCSYEVFGFAQEFYVVVNYDVDTYQWMAFGRSTVPGLTGQGGWCGASCGAYTGSTIEPSATNPIRMDLFGGGISNISGPKQLAPALMWFRNTPENLNGPECRNSWVNSGLDGHGWRWGATADYQPIGARATANLMKLIPNTWNSDTVLLPLRAYKERPSFKSSMVLDLENARFTRIDNNTNGELLVIGSDRWKVFPWYRKDITSRNAGTNINHTGTFGWAIRYEGP